MEVASSSSAQTLLTNKPPAPQYSLKKLIALTVAFAGIQFCWAVQVGYVTKTLQERLGLAKRFVSYAWLAGPIAGIIVQPTVGLLSDRLETRFGRRRPFILGGSLVAAAALLSFAWAKKLWVGILSFWVLDFAINAAQGPLRALLTDVVPREQQGLGNACFALMSGIGNASGNFLGSLQLASFVKGDLEDVQVLFAIAVVVLLVTVGISVGLTEEKVERVDGGYERIGKLGVIDHQSSDSNSNTEPAMSLWKATLNAPKPFWNLFTIQNFMWFAWFCVFIFTTSWVGTSVFEGDPIKPKGDARRDLYDEGVRLGNLGLGIQAVVSILYSMVLPFLLDKFGYVSVYFFANIIHGLAMCSTLLLVGRSSASFALASIAILGIPWATTMTVPWALVGSAVSGSAPNSTGVFITIFNLAQCFPEIVVSLFSEELIRWSGKEVTVIAIGGAVALIGAVLVLVLDIDVKSTEEVAVV
eukprot:Plantae.Rhodophyta-Hildenbrandia_rubra.ctg22997.p1 GENE.Plantae.Rhodophyta-Hildenbrandia_rubra.ctg22997~~Plantae.Rhodophyta-Hildenbrandia_rubra.ctg22997.p1  ORF type:complete len:471 (-),score=63.75 Plantae.Rhodophyta-Hildenbrandia_rubra.ctg22997:281-1693(-)